METDPTVEADGPTLPAGGGPSLLACTAVALLILGAAHGRTLLDPSPLLDEDVYRDAMDAVARGRPLSSVDGWYYPDIGAHVAERLRANLGETALYRGTRLVNLLGVALTVGWAAAELHGHRPRTLALRALLILGLAALPATTTCVIVGNVSGVLLVLLLGALALPSSTRAVPLAISFMWKPYGLVLALGQRGRSAVIPLLAAGLAWLGTSTRDGFPHLDTIRNNALVRPLHAIGLPVPWQVVTALVLAAALVFRPRGASALAVGWLALPIAWDHTGLLVFPALGAAIARPAAIAGDRRLGLVLALLAGAVLANGGLFGSDDASAAISGLIGLAPPTAVMFLAYVSHRDRTRPRGPSVARTPLGHFDR